jgi:hypothetical protein
MSFAPASAIIFVNNDILTSINDMLVKQLFIDEVIDGYTLDQRVAADSNYASSVVRLRQKIMVVRSFSELTNRDIADVVIFVAGGLATVEVNKFGPPGATFAVVNLHWAQLGL